MDLKEKTKKQFYFWEQIAFRIMLGFFAPLFVSCYVLYSVSVSFTDMREMREKIQSTWAAVRINEAKAVLNLTRARMSLDNMWSVNTQTVKPNAYLQYFEQEVVTIGKVANDQEELDGKKIYLPLANATKQAYILMDQMGDAVRRIDHAEWDREKSQLVPLLVEMERSVDKLSAYHELVELRELSSITSSEGKFTNGLYYMIAAVAFFGLALSVFVTISIATPIKQLIRRLQDIATGEGDLTKRIDNRLTTGEMREVAGWMNLFLDKTQSIIATIANAAVTIRRTTEQVSGFTNTSTILAVSINKTMMTQSMNLDDCSLSLNKIDDLLQASGDSSRQAASLSKIAMDRALQGGASVNETIEAMEKIEESADKVEVLVSSINDIAAQTNLLAINAAIEASKAGEHGKGFAVVAEEVRKLAERTRKLTGQVTTLITESNSRVKTGVSLAKNAGVALDGIIKDVEAVASLIQRIAASATKQTESSAQLVGGMHKVTDGIHENLKQMNQVTQSVEYTSTEVLRLDALVNELNMIVGQFKLESGKDPGAQAPMETISFHDGDGSRNIAASDRDPQVHELQPRPLPRAPDAPPPQPTDETQDVA